MIEGRAYSYNYTNIDVIKTLTHPRFSLIGDKATFGSGVISSKEMGILNDSDNLKLRNLNPKISKYYLETDYNKPLLIHVPKRFLDVMNSVEDKLIFESLSFKDYSQGLKDMKRSLSMRNVENIQDIDLIIRTFNNNIENKLERLSLPLFNNYKLAKIRERLANKIIKVWSE